MSVSYSSMLLPPPPVGAWALFSVFAKWKIEERFCLVRTYSRIAPRGSKVLRYRQATSDGYDVEKTVWVITIKMRRVVLKFHPLSAACGGGGLAITLCNTGCRW